MNEFVFILFYFILLFLLFLFHFHNNSILGQTKELFGVFLHVRHIFKEQRGEKLLRTLDKFRFSGATLTDFFFFFPSKST